MREENSLHILNLMLTSESYAYSSMNIKSYVCVVNIKVKLNEARFSKYNDKCICLEPHNKSRTQ